MDATIMENLGGLMGVILLGALVFKIAMWREKRRERKKPEPEPPKTWAAMPMPGMGKPVDFYDGCLCSIIGDLKVVDLKEREDEQPTTATHDQNDNA